MIPRMKRALLLLLLPIGVFAQTKLISPATISGDGSSHAVATDTSQARFVVFFAPPTNTSTNCNSSSMTACPRVGDSAVSTSRGLPLLPGASVTYPVLNDSHGVARYLLSALFYIVQSGDTLIVQYAQ